jgi:glycine cleavage system H protein
MSKPIAVKGSIVKAGLLYSKTHEWIDLNKSPHPVGISDYAQRSLHDLVYVELPKAGQFVKSGSLLCTLESVKAVADTFAPVDGIVVQINEALNEKPELVNNDPYGEGWLVMLEAKGGNEGLLKPEEYSEFLKKLP